MEGVGGGFFLNLTSYVLGVVIFFLDSGKLKINKKTKCFTGGKSGLYLVKKKKKQKSNVHNRCVDLVYDVDYNDYDSIVVVVINSIDGL